MGHRIEDGESRRRHLIESKGDVEFGKVKMFIDLRSTSEFYMTAVSDPFALAAHAYWHKATQKYWFGYDQLVGYEETDPPEGGHTGQLVSVSELDSNSCWRGSLVVIKFKRLRLLDPPRGAKEKNFGNDPSSRPKRIWEVKVTFEVMETAPGYEYMVRVVDEEGDRNRFTLLGRERAVGNIRRSEMVYGCGGTQAGVNTRTYFRERPL